MWSRTGTRSLVSVPVSTRPTFSFDAPKRLFSMTDYQNRFAISRDDSKFLMVRRLRGVSLERLTMVDNWRQDLVRLQDSGGFPRSELPRIILMVRQHEAALLRSWNDYFAD